ncbi:MAG TPA: hypothetical protein VF868_09265 [Bacteroidia bacterium]|jgi:hypothetical protein
MKTQFTQTATRSIQVFLITFLSLLLTSVQAQTKTPGEVGIRGSASISANGFGTILSPAVFYKKGKSNFVFSLTMQKKMDNVSGVMGTYEYTLVDPQSMRDCYIDWLELYAFVNGGYHKSVYLGESASEQEGTSNAEFKADLSTVQLRAIEGYVGIGLRINLVKNLKWFNNTGFGAYQVMNAPAGLFYNSKAVGLSVTTGLSYQFGLGNKPRY